MKPADSLRVPGLDGLRGVMMLSVVLCHLQLFGGGWMMMPLFYILSGFLITRLILADVEHAPSARALFLRFYARRSLRIFPIFYLYLALVSIAAWMTEPDGKWGPYISGAFFYVYNYLGILDAFQDRNLVTNLINHCWSLAIEEQFYLVWPFVIYFTPRRYYLHLFALLAIAATLYRAAIVAYWPPHQSAPWLINAPYAPALAVYLSPFSYLDAFAAGAALNVIKFTPKPRVVLILILAAAMLGLLVNGPGAFEFGGAKWRFTFGYPILMADHYQYIWGYTVIVIVGVVTIASARGDNGLRRALSHSWLVWLGERTYGGYLYHVAVIYILTQLLHPHIAQIVDGPYLAHLMLLPPVLLMLAAVCAISYNFIEIPIYRFKEKFFPRLK